jgi:hypothetical protein
MLRDKITDGRKRRTDNHPVMDLPRIDSTQLFLNHHAMHFHHTTEKKPEGE